MILTIGNKCKCTKNSTATDKMCMMNCIIGANSLKPRIVIMNARIPLEVIE